MMNGLRIFRAVTLCVATSACADVGASATGTSTIDRTDPAHDILATVTPNPSVFAGNMQQHATVSVCEQGDETVELWRRAVGEGDPILPMSVKTDGSRNVYVTRAIGETRKLDASGNTVWTRPFGSLVDIAGDASIFVAGTFEGSLRVGPSQNLAAAGGKDVFVAKLDEDGNVLFAVALGGTGDEDVSSVAAASDGVIVSGTGIGTVKLDGEDGHTDWTRPLVGAVAVNEGDEVLFTGALVGTATYDKVLTSAGGRDVLVVKLSPSGDYLWSRSYGDAGPSQLGQSIAVDPSGAVLIGGVVDGSVDFGGGPITVPPGTCPTESPCDAAGFVSKLDTDGNFVFSRGIVPALEVSGIASDAAGNVYAAGSYPGDVAPYRTTLLVGFDAEGSKRALPSYDSVPGAGHAIAADSCGNVVFAFAIAGASPDELGRAYVAKLLVH
jgi:hypothetical protein